VHAHPRQALLGLVSHQHHHSLVPRFVDPEDRPLFFGLLLRGLCGADRASPPPPSNHFIKVFDGEGQVRLFLLQARRLSPESPLVKNGVAESPSSRGEPEGPRMHSGLFLRFEPVQSKYVSGRPLSRVVIQQFQPAARSAAAAAAAAEGAAPASPSEERQAVATNQPPSVLGLTCLPLGYIDANIMPELLENASVLFPPEAGPVVVADPGPMPAEREEEELEEEAAPEPPLPCREGGFAGSKKRQRQSPQPSEQEQQPQPPQRRNRRRRRAAGEEQEEEEANAHAWGGGPRYGWEDGHTLASALVMATPPLEAPFPSPLQLPRYPNPLPDFVMASTADSPGRADDVGLTVPELSEQEIGAIFERISDVRGSEIEAGLSPHAASAAVAAAVAAAAGAAAAAAVAVPEHPYGFLQPSEQQRQMHQQEMFQHQIQRRREALYQQPRRHTAPSPWEQPPHHEFGLPQPRRQPPPADGGSGRP
jgi:hypothetical protein